MRTLKSWVIAWCLVVVTAQFCSAAGFAIYEWGARDMALGGATVGRADDPAALSSNPAPLRARRTSFSDSRLRSGLMRTDTSRVPQIWQSNAHNFRHCLSAIPRREQSGQDWNATCAVIRASVWVIVPKVRD